MRECAGKEKKKEDKNKSRRLSQVQRCYDFEQDAPYIYAAFLTQYRLDLSMTLNYDLHWWKFRAMFESLDENLKISKIMYYRTAKTTGMSKQQRNVINIMKSLYALESPETSADSKMKLAKRNLEMKEYVRNRMKEVKNAQEKLSVLIAATGCLYFTMRRQNATAHSTLQGPELQEGI